MTIAEQRAFLHTLAERMAPTVDNDYDISSRDRRDGGVTVTLTDEDDNETSLDLYYVRHDDLGHLVKAVDTTTAQTKEYYFYAHGHILAALMLT